jgi:haloacetate dehalogenase
MFERFERKRLTTSGGATINFVVGGSGQPLLLLHGYPQTHVMWHRIAPDLAADFTVVVADLRGYGDSSKPPGASDHANYSKRVMAQDQIDVMRSLGFDRFAVVGHDRGGRVAYRMAIDQADAVSKLAVLDIIPTHNVYSNVSRLLATAYYHWFMLIQPFDLPERLIGGDPEYFLRTSLDRWSGTGLSGFDPAAVDEYVRCFCTAEGIHATCEDYRAGASVDFQHDAEDVGKQRISCPALVLVGQRGLARLNAHEIWEQWCTDVRVQELPCGHFLPEEAPEETYAALREFLLG